MFYVSELLASELHREKRTAYSMIVLFVRKARNTRRRRKVRRMEKRNMTD